MTAKQLDLLQRLIWAERYYVKEKEQNGCAERRLRLVEVGSINGVDPRTAQSLVDIGLCDSEQGEQPGRWYVWLADNKEMTPDYEE